VTMPLPVVSERNTITTLVRTGVEKSLGANLSFLVHTSWQEIPSDDAAMEITIDQWMNYGYMHSFVVHSRLENG
jgi:hypothetical protein